MKPLIFLYALAFTLSAHASFYQITCSNADGSVRLSQGHVRNKAYVKTEVDGKTKEFEFGLDQIVIEDMKDPKEIVRERKGCDKNGPDVQIVSGKTTTVRVVKMNVDSKLESRKPFEDLKTVLLCESYMNSQALCRK